MNEVQVDLVSILERAREVCIKKLPVVQINAETQFVFGIINESALGFKLPLSVGDLPRHVSYFLF